MKHAIVGVGGVGGLMAAALAHVGEHVTVIVRPKTYARYPEKLKLESMFGNFEVPVERATELRGWYDIIWLAVKATQLEETLSTISAAKDGFGAIVPLLNGVDHIEELRCLYGGERVIPATIAVESERVAPGHIRHKSPFVRLAVASWGKAKLEGVLQKLSDFGFTCEFVDDEKTLMWRKLIFLAPFALATSASGLPAGGLRNALWRDRWFDAIREAGAVAKAEGAKVDVDAAIKMSESLPDTMTSSMFKDITAGNTPELDAIAGPILRGGEKHGIPTPNVSGLAKEIEAKISPR